MRFIATALAATLAVCAIGYVSFLTALPVNSAELTPGACHTIEEASARMRENLYEVVGVREWHGNTYLILKAYDGVFGAPIVDGCVSEVAVRLRDYPENEA